VEALALLGGLVLHLALIALPAVALTLLAARAGIRSVPVLLAIALAASGAVGFLGFWAYYADRVLGETFSYLVLIGSPLLAFFALWGGKIERSLLGQLVVPLALWCLGSAFLVFFGFLHGGDQDALKMASHRFSHQLPSDNAIPYFFSEWFFNHGNATPVPIFPGEWLSSDRPPLQTGYALYQRPFAWGDEPKLHYQLLAVALQQLWIVGLWALLLAARLNRLTRSLLMVSVLVSGLAIVNGFFVWPKLLPAAMLLAAAALVLTPAWEEVRRSYWGAALIGALFALAMLGHGSSAFGIIPLAVVIAYRSRLSLRWIGVLVAIAIALFIPWSAYQKYADPPGNRVLKWTLAGVSEIDDRGVTEAILDSYGEAGLGGTIHNKAENFVTMAGGGPAVDSVENALDTGSIGEVVASIRVVDFFYLLPGLGLLWLGPLAMIFGWRRGRTSRPEWIFACTCFAVVAGGAIVWGLILFGNESERAVLHLGSYLLPILAICGAVAGLRAVLPRFAIYYAALNAVLLLALYVPSFTPTPGTSFSPLAALFAAASLGGFLALALRGTPGRPETAPPVSQLDSAA
jgi:hypothetical protein